MGRSNYSTIPVNPRAIQNEVTRGFVFFSHPDYIDQGTGDIYALAPDEREVLADCPGEGSRSDGHGD